MVILNPLSWLEQNKNTRIINSNLIISVILSIGVNYFILTIFIMVKILKSVSSKRWIKKWDEKILEFKAQR